MTNMTRVPMTTRIRTIIFILIHFYPRSAHEEESLEYLTYDQQAPF